MSRKKNHSKFTSERLPTNSGFDSDGILGLYSSVIFDRFKYRFWSGKRHFSSFVNQPVITQIIPWVLWVYLRAFWMYPRVHRSHSWAREGFSIKTLNVSAKGNITSPIISGFWGRWLILWLHFRLPIFFSRWGSFHWIIEPNFFA